MRNTLCLSIRAFETHDNKPRTECRSHIGAVRVDNEPVARIIVEKIKWKLAIDASNMQDQKTELNREGPQRQMRLSPTHTVRHALFQSGRPLPMCTSKPYIFYLHTSFSFVDYILFRSRSAYRFMFNFCFYHLRDSPTLTSQEDEEVGSTKDFAHTGFVRVAVRRLWTRATDTYPGPMVSRLRF